MLEGKIASPLLGSKLRELRKKKGVNGPQLLAKLMGGAYSPATILRRESGKLRIDSRYLEIFSRALKLSVDERHKLLTELNMGVWKSSGNTSKILSEYYTLSENAYSIYCYVGSVVPGYLQTLPYATAIIQSYGTVNDTTAAAKERLRFSESIVKKGGKNVKVACSESALYTPYGNPKLMAEQMKKLLEFADETFFEFRILPNDMYIDIPRHESYEIIDNSYAICETIVGILTSEEVIVANYLKEKLDEIWENSVIGIRRNQIVEKALKHYQALV